MKRNRYGKPFVVVPVAEEEGECWMKWSRARVNAHEAVRRALRAGKLARQSCQVCGSPDAHAHHPDYGKPLDVWWLCVKHHKLIHRVLDKARRVP